MIILMKSKFLINVFLVLDDLIVRSKLVIDDDTIKLIPTGNVIANISLGRSSMSLREYSIITKLNLKEVIIRVDDVNSVKYYKLSKHEYDNLIRRLEFDEVYDTYLECHNTSYRLLLDRSSLRKLKSLLHSNK